MNGNLIKNKVLLHLPTIGHSLRAVRGFTLIELLVVISIIGFLATAAVVSLNSARVKSRDAKRRADMTQIQKAIEMYYQENGSYPLCSGSSVCSTNGYQGDMRNLAIVPTYLAKMPIDPVNINNSYAYYYARGYTTNGSSCPAATANDYILATRLEVSSKAGINCWSNPNVNHILGNTSEYR